jgi:NodT family efflux transporter outer membrane factor (OMF) lipoprotein
VQLIVTANVASGWLQAVALRERVAIAERNLASAERLLALVETRVQAGAATPLELAQQRGLALGQRRQVTALRQQAEDAGSTLGRLLGQTEAPRLATATQATLLVPAHRPVLRSDLLVRRPDIERAEAQRVAASANVQAARAAMLPRLTLTAALGTESDRLGRVFDNPLYSLAAGLTAPIFDAGRLAANRDGAQARHEELLATYRQAIVTAFADVEVALHAVARLDEQAATQAEELVQAERAVQLAENRYRAGAETLLTLLDSQGKWYTAQDLAVQLKGLRLQAAVSLYRSLGGGWQLAPASSLYSLPTEAQYPRRSSTGTGSVAAPVMRRSVRVTTSMSLSKPPCAARCCTFWPAASSATVMRSAAVRVVRRFNCASAAARRQAASASPVSDEPSQPA